MNELAARNLSTLLDRAFEINKIPPAEQQGRRTLIALARLSDANAKLTPSQRQKLIADVVAGIGPALPSINDPQLLMRQAVVLINSGVERDVNTLEYWGENPRTQAQLRPVVQTVIKILERAAELARKQAEELANKISAANSPAVARYEEMERLASTAEYNAKMAEYYLAIALDRSSPSRAQICDDAFNYLKQFDVDENPDRNIVRTRMAKLAMAKSDYATARQYFDLVTDSPTAERKNIAVQYDARYFAAVNELLSQNIDGAKKHLEDLLAWQTGNLPKDKASQDGAEAAAAMLRYRIASLEAEGARDATAKKAANDRAVGVLMDLMSRRPDLRGVIYEQLLPRLDENADLATVDPLLLRALIAKGEEQLHRGGGDDPPDAKTIDRALQAARQVAARRGKPGIDGQLVDSSALLVGFFLQTQEKLVEAAAAFLDYADQFKVSSPQNAKLALDNAEAIIGQLRKGDRRDEAEVVKAYERFLPLAINPPFGRVQFAFEYARRLQLNGKAPEAMKYFRLVPPGDSRALDARYFELVARKQELDELPPGVDRSVALSSIQTLANDVNQAAGAAMSRASDERQRNNYRLMLARTALLAADLARREQKDPKRALALLENFDSSVQGLPGAEALAADAMLVRVQSYMALERYGDATQQLVKLLNKTEGGRGAQIVYNLLEKLNADFERAQLAGDANQLRGLARNRAQLSGFLVDWAANNKDPNIQKFTYRYKVFDAETQRLAAVLEEQPGAREAGLTRALERFAALESAENVALYKASLGSSVAPGDADLYDPQVAFGVARINYDLEKWKEAADGFSKLILARKLGTPLNSIEEDGQTKYVDNDAYWEAVYKLIQCNVKLGSGVEESKSFLKQQYITWGDRVGGKKWKDAYEQLRRQFIPDFDPKSISATTAPTTQAT